VPLQSKFYDSHLLSNNVEIKIQKPIILMRTDEENSDCNQAIKLPPNKHTQTHKFAAMRHKLHV